MPELQLDTEALAPCSVCGSTEICCGDAENGRCVAHCSPPVVIRNNDVYPQN